MAMKVPVEASTILLVEDEPVLRTSMARGLGRLANVEVLTAGNFKEASALLESQPPSLIISDIDLPGAPGVDLIGELQRRQQNIPILFITAYLKTFRAQIPSSDNVQVLEKPVPLEDLRAKVTELLGPEATQRRTPFGVADYVQLACIGRHSVRIDIALATGDAYVIVNNGEVWSAVDTLGSGEEAFARVAFSACGLITCSSLVGEPGARTISMRWEALALRSARVFHEAERERESAFPSSPSLARLRVLDTPAPTNSSTNAPSAPRKGPPPIPLRARNVRQTSLRAPAPPSPSSSGAPAYASFEQLWAAGVDALLRREFAHALQSFSAADKIRPNEPRVVANLQRLKEMGYDHESRVEGVA